MSLSDENRVRRTRRKLFAIASWIYLVLGLISIGVGLFVQFGLGASVGKPTRPDPDITLVAFVFIGFGVLRIVTALRNLRRLSPRL